MNVKKKELCIKSKTLRQLTKKQENEVNITKLLSVLQAVYKAYDRDCSGTIGADELPGAFKAAGKHPLWIYIILTCNNNINKTQRMDVRCIDYKTDWNWLVKNYLGQYQSCAIFSPVGTGP